MPHPAFILEGTNAARPALAAALATNTPKLPCLVNADDAPDAQAVIARCNAFAASLSAGQEALIVTLLPSEARADQAVLSAFTRAAALDWAPRRLRVNAIALAGSSAGAIPPHILADLARTLHLMAALPSMTGQTIQLRA